MLMRSTRTLFDLPEWVKPALISAWNAEPDADPGPEGVLPYPAGNDDDLLVMETIQTYFGGEVINLRFLRTEEVKDIFNLLCIFHPHGRKIMASIKGEQRRLLNQICRATSQILSDRD